MERENDDKSGTDRRSARNEPGNFSDVYRSEINGSDRLELDLGAVSDMDPTGSDRRCSAGGGHCGYRKEVEMDNRKALEIIQNEIKCNETDFHDHCMLYDNNCTGCEYEVSREDLDEALRVAVEALELIVSMEDDGK